jgi:hypothetical protein
MKRFAIEIPPADFVAVIRIKQIFHALTGRSEESARGEIGDGAGAFLCFLRTGPSDDEMTGEECLLAV